VRIPYELIDVVIDCIGTRYTYGSVVDRFFHCPHYRSEATELKSLAPAPRACNHRVRSHLFRKLQSNQCRFLIFRVFRAVSGCSHWVHSHPDDSPRYEPDNDPCLCSSFCLVTIGICEFLLDVHPEGTSGDARVGLAQRLPRQGRILYTQPPHPHKSGQSPRTHRRAPPPRV